MRRNRFNKQHFVWQNNFMRRVIQSCVNSMFFCVTVLSKTIITIQRL